MVPEESNLSAIKTQPFIKQLRVECNQCYACFWWFSVDQRQTEAKQEDILLQLCNSCEGVDYSCDLHVYDQPGSKAELRIILLSLWFSELNSALTCYIAVWCSALWYQIVLGAPIVELCKFTTYFHLLNTPSTKHFEKTQPPILLT